MYPFFRIAKELFKHRKAPALSFLDEHVSTHMCLPWDLDIWMELNNGRTLSIYDLGRIPLARRTGMVDALRRKRWGMTMAGACVRYRRRIRVFETITMRSRAVCWDSRFVYIEQSMWAKGGECANHVVYRAAITGPKGIVDPGTLAEAMGISPASPPPPPFIAAWIEAENQRPWPPMSDA